MTVISCPSVNTHSAMTVDVARKTKAGVTIVATAIASASGHGRPRTRAKYQKAARPTPIIAAIDTLFSRTTLSGKLGLIRKTRERIAGKPGGAAGRICATAELVSR